MSLEKFQAEHLPKVEAELTNFILKETQNPRLAKSMAYSVAAGGKRIRPLILLSVMASFGKKPDTGAYQCGAALEMIHTYSLIHDDLPAMDDDDLRRGKPTNHIVFGEGLAILAGDGLLTEAFHLLSQGQIASDEKLFLIQLLAKKAGTSGMVAGQAADLQGENQALTLGELQDIHQKKTGDLLTFAFVAGGVLAQQTPSVLQKLTQLAQHVGLAFQIRDDLLDVVATTEEIGKESHHDQEKGKSTYPALLGINGAKQALAKELALAKDCLIDLEEQTLFQGSLVAEILEKFEL